MKVIELDLNRDYSDVIREAVNILSYGGTVVYPTDTLYGLGANALDDISIRKIFNLKQRSFSKPLPMIVRDMTWAKELAEISSRNEAFLKKVWPGRVTAILPKKEMVPDSLTSGQKTVGIRIPDHSFVNELLKHYGYPMTSTSANMSGDEPSRNIKDIIDIFSRSTLKPSLIIDVGNLQASDPSTIIDLTTHQPKILRVGPSKPDQLLKLLEM